MMSEETWNAVAFFAFFVVAILFLYLLSGCTADQVGSAAKNCLLPGDETGYHNQYCDGYGQPRPIPQVKDWCKHRDNIGVCEDV